MVADIVLVTPITPSDRGNGLAMRAGMFLEALAPSASVHVVVVPVAGRIPIGEWATDLTKSMTVVDLVGEADADRHVVLQMSDATLRTRLERTAPLPLRARQAAPSLVGETIGHLDTELVDEAPIVVVMRHYLVPFGVTMARRLGASRIVVDLDDDDEALLRETGDNAGAAGVSRLARTWLDDADLVTLASPFEAIDVAARYNLPNVEAVANTARAPLRPPGSPEGSRVLFVGNLTYEPNIDAARTLARDVLPALRRVHPTAAVDLVGSRDERISDLAQLDGVTVVGPVPDVAPWYDRAAVVVIPLASGGGTRIKVLEAFAHRRPVVATSAAVAGIDAQAGVDVLIADTVEGLAHSTASILSDPETSSRLSTAAFAIFATRYAPEVVGPTIRRVVLGDEQALEGS